ncbi:MAG: hypothetical protein ACRCZJ_01980 [Erysipelotrichaceae bacterium]
MKLQKDQKKILRGMVQAIILCFAVGALLISFVETTAYEPYQDQDVEESTTPDSGFITIAYFGTSRVGSDINIATSRLEEHLSLLYENGYVTITQQDVMDYYAGRKNLPERSLFLLFEDGYTGTAIFAEDILQKYNYKATMVGYANNLAANDLGLLDEKDYRELSQRDFWEVGSNGYRLAFINVFDLDENYLGDLSIREMNAIGYEVSEYNHYLMDYKRDAFGIPKESTSELQKRIDDDYRLMEQAYLKAIGRIPDLYVLMHSNTDAFGTHPNASSVNETNIKNMFQINYNREGFALNNRDNSIYDLTRTQAQAYWYPNHLLMRVKNDVGEDVVFRQGDPTQASDWTVVNGAVEFRDELIALTSEPSSTGRIELKDVVVKDDLNVSMRLLGNIMGYQTIYLRVDETQENYIKISIGNNELSVYEQFEGNEITVTEQKIDASLEPKDIQVKDAGDYQLGIQVHQDRLTIQINGKEYVDVELRSNNAGGVVLESAWLAGEGFRNTYDDVYDGAFSQIRIEEGKTLLYSNEQTGWNKVVYTIQQTIDRVVNWFIDTL